MIRLITLLLLILFSAVTTQARETLVFSTFQDSESPEIVLAKKIVTEAYSRLGIDVKIRYMSEIRAVKQANKKKTDGLLFHRPEFSTAHAKLIKVTPPVFYTKWVGFTVSENIEINSWESLKSYRVGYTNGESKVVKRLPDFDKVGVDSIDALLGMLSNYRIDVAVGPYLTGLYTIKNGSFSDIRITAPLETYPMYHYLNRKHSDLIKKVETVFNKMEDEGVVESFRNEVEAGLQ